MRQTAPPPLIPISLDAMEKAIELNGVDIERNMTAFSWGRKYYEDAAWVEHCYSAQLITRRMRGRRY